MCNIRSILMRAGAVLVGAYAPANFAVTTGTITVNGLIQNDPTCSLSAGDVSRTITLDPVKVSDFAGLNSVGAKTFTLTANCQNATQATFTFTGTADTVDSYRFKNNGTAAGVALWLYSNIGGTPSTIRADGVSNTRTVSVTSNVASLALGAAYWKTGTPAPGTLTSQVTVGLTYQ